MRLVESLDRMSINQKYLKYKPTLPLKEDERGWWRYAITAILEEDVKRRTRMWSWKHMKEHRYVMWLIMWLDTVVMWLNTVVMWLESFDLGMSLMWLDVLLYSHVTLLLVMWPVLSHRKNCKTYTKLYTDKLLSPKAVPNNLQAKIDVR